MIARSHLPAHFACWNGATGAPYHGPFALYPYNCATRIWEYPWAFHAIPSQPGMRALDIGGGLSGFAVTLARNKLEVTVLDPGKSGQEPGVLLEQLARMHGAEVRHVEGHPGDPGLAPTASTWCTACPWWSTCPPHRREQGSCAPRGTRCGPGGTSS